MRGDRCNYSWKKVNILGQREAFGGAAEQRKLDAVLLRQHGDHRVQCRERSIYVPEEPAGGYHGDLRRERGAVRGIRVRRVGERACGEGTCDGHVHAAAQQSDPLSRVLL